MQKLYEETYIQQIANSIRAKRGVQTKYLVRDMSGAIDDINELKGETRTITPTITQQIISPSANKNGITEITINAVDNTIDSNIQANNIKKNITILRNYR